MKGNRVVIIGSGLGGLLCGDILANYGYHVTIVEQHYKLGGNLHSFNRKGHTFDTGMHYIGSLDEGQTLHQFFKYFDLLEGVKMRRLNAEGFDVIHFKNKRYKYAMGYEPYIETLCSYFPHEREGIEKYVNTIMEITESDPLYRLEEMNLKDMDYISPFMSIGAYDFIKSCTSNYDLQNVLAGHSFLEAGDKNKTPLYIHAHLRSFYIQSAYGFVGGSCQIADRLADNIRKKGGELYKMSRATNIRMEGKKAVAVEINNKKEIEADIIISGIHPQATMELVKTEQIRKSYRSRLASLENTISAFSAFIILKKDVFPQMDYNFYHFGFDTTWSVNKYTPETWTNNYMFYTPMSDDQNGYAKTANILTYMQYDEVKEWENTTIEKRGQAYLDFKQKKLEEIVAKVEIDWPGLSASIDTCYTATPLTYRDYTAAPQGSMYGVVRDYHEPLRTMIPARTRVPNLFLTGQNTNIHGFLGVTFGSLITCGEILGINNVIKAIKDA